MGVGIDYNSFYLVKVRDEFECRKFEEVFIVVVGMMDMFVIGFVVVFVSIYGVLMFSLMWGMREMGFVFLVGIFLIVVMVVYFIGLVFMSFFGEKVWWLLFKSQKGVKKE